MHLFACLRKKVGNVALPGWLLSAGMAVYCELLLHLWITENLKPLRFGAVLAFALGFGGLTGLLNSLFDGKKWGKWVTFSLNFLLCVFYLAEFFCVDAYKNFMSPGMMLGGARGVATDFAGVAFSLIWAGAWRILLMLLPVLLYAVFARPVPVGRRTRALLLAAVLGGYGLGYGLVQAGKVDRDKLDKSYSFDGAIRAFGLHMGVTLEAVHGSGAVPEQLETLVPVTPPPTQPRETQTTEPGKPAGQTEPTAPTEYGLHTIEGLDFAALAGNKTYGSIRDINTYLASLPAAKENQYTGLFRGKNLILITAEAFSTQTIDPELTPTLYRLATKGIRFTDYYQPAWGGSTTTGEFSNVVGLIPSTKGMCMSMAVEQPLFLTIGSQLQREGYYSAAYHNHYADFYSRNHTHTHLGYDRFIARYQGLEGLTEEWPESDLEMMDITVPDYIDRQPFSIYYMTVSGHCGYSLQENAQSRKNYDAVKDLDCSEAVKCYLAAQLELEKAMTSLLRQLEEAGIADDTVIVLSPDHYPYGLERSAAWKTNRNYLCELLDVDKLTPFNRDSNTLIIWSGCLEGMDLQVDTPVYSLDILPTLSNLFGVPYDSRLLVGRDVFSEEMPLVLWPNYSWKTDRGTYDAAEDVFTPADGQEADREYIDYVCALVRSKFSYCTQVQNTHYFRWLAQYLEEENE